MANRLLHIVLIVSAFSFYNDLVAQHEPDSSGMQWYSFKDAQEKASEEGKHILIFGMADWCPYCRKMLKEVYTDSSVQKTISKYFYPVMLDTESENMVYFDGTEVEERKLAAYLRLQSLPTHYFMDEDWVIFGLHPGFVPAEIFKPMLEYVGTGSHESMTFDEFIKVDD